MDTTPSVPPCLVEDDGTSPVPPKPTVLPTATPAMRPVQYPKNEPSPCAPPEGHDEEGVPLISSTENTIPVSTLEEVSRNSNGSCTSVGAQTVSTDSLVTNAPAVVAAVVATPPPPPRRQGDTTPVARRRSSQVVIPSLEVDTKGENHGNVDSGRVAPNIATHDPAPPSSSGIGHLTSTPRHGQQHVRRLYTPPKSQQFDSLTQKPKVMKGEGKGEKPVRPSSAPPSRLPSQHDSPHIRNQYRPTSPRWATPGGASYRAYNRGRGLSAARNQTASPLSPDHSDKDTAHGQKSGASPRHAKLLAGTKRAQRNTKRGPREGKGAASSKRQPPKRGLTPRSVQSSRRDHPHTSNQAPEFVVSQGGVSFTRTARFSHGIYDVSGSGADVDYDPYRGTSIEGKQSAMIRRQRARALLAMRKDQTERKRPKSSTGAGSRLASASSILNNTFYNPASKASTGSRVGPGSYVTIAMLEKDWELMTNTTASSFRSKDKRIQWLENLVRERLGPSFGPGKYENFSDDFKGIKVHDKRRPSSAFASQSSRY
eukprot:TRINITY_DN32968_c0_g1_i1.p1 TRINITY_DN32968_c0_g1~~TRINITY_DN32968_c0_g1_i1.p1  ORF type:complete len:540 (+),score=5.47 TRINITY_DN32968_c0_g1_i1:116-1735(+)